MTHLALHFIDGPADLSLGNMGMWLFLSIGAVCLFVVFIPLTSFIDARRREREAFYKAETFRRLAESSSEGAKTAIDFLRTEDRLKRNKTREGLKIAGLINIAVGIGICILLYAMSGGKDGFYLVGTIPGLLGVSMLVYVFLLSAPVE